jgi:hypothetical protein
MMMTPSPPPTTTARSIENETALEERMMTPQQQQPPPEQLQLQLHPHHADALAVIFQHAARVRPGVPDSPGRMVWLIDCCCVAATTHKSISLFRLSANIGSSKDRDISARTEHPPGLNMYSANGLD